MVLYQIPTISQGWGSGPGIPSIGALAGRHRPVLEDKLHKVNNVKFISGINSSNKFSSTSGK